MSTKKNLPNIPIYIGDWERDCNVLTLEAEAAWMRIVFKLWSKGKQNSIKIPTKSLQNLWRCSPEKMQEILEELIYNEIAEIKVSERFVSFTCRRFVKENELSKKRSEAGKSGKKKNKTQSKSNQTQIKSEQNTENDTDNESEYEIDIVKGGLGEKTNPEEYMRIDELKEQMRNEYTWRNALIRNTKNTFPDFNTDDFWVHFEEFFKQIENDGEEEKTVKDAKKHFSRWLNIKIQKENEQSNSTKERKYGRQSKSTIRKDMQGW